MVKKLWRIVQNFFRNGYYLNCKYRLQKFINAFSYDVIPRDDVVCQLPQKSKGSKKTELILFLYGILKPPEGDLWVSKYAQNLNDAYKKYLC